MVIGIDGDEANQEQRVGVHQMAFEILWGLFRKNLVASKNGKLEDMDNQFVVYLKKAPKSDLPPEGPGWKYKVIPGKRLWVLTKLMPHLFSKERPDVFYSPTHYLPPFAPMPMVCTIMDLGYLEFTGQFTKKDFWQLKIWTAISIIVSKYIITISKSTRKDIVRHYRFASKKIKTIYLAANSIVTKSKINKNLVRRIYKKYRINKKYILFISTLKPGKNVDGLVEAYSNLRQRNDYQLVIAGKKGWLFEPIFEKVKKLGIENDVIFTDYLKEEEKPVLLSNASAFVLPSFWEGFGIDVLNAFALGVPVVVSDVASLREVAGNAAVGVDPYDVGTITKGLEKVINMKPLEHNRQVQKGYEQLKKFSWDKSVNQTLAVLRSAGNSR